MIRFLLVVLGAIAPLQAYAVCGTDNASAGITLASPVDLNGGTITATTGGATATNGFTSPNMTGVILSKAYAISLLTAPANGSYYTGQVLSFAVTWNNATLTVTGTPYISLTIGSNTRQATYASGSGTTILTFSYTIVAGDLANGTTSTTSIASPITLNGGTITGCTLATINNFTPPTLTGVLVNYPPAANCPIGTNVPWTQGANNCSGPSTVAVTSGTSGTVTATNTASGYTGTLTTATCTNGVLSTPETGAVCAVAANCPIGTTVNWSQSSNNCSGPSTVAVASGVSGTVSATNTAGGYSGTLTTATCNNGVLGTPETGQICNAVAAGPMLTLAMVVTEHIMSSHQQRHPHGNEQRSGRLSLLWPGGSRQHRLRAELQRPKHHGVQCHHGRAHGNGVCTRFKRPCWHRHIRLHGIHNVLQHE